MNVTQICRRADLLEILDKYKLSKESVTANTVYRLTAMLILQQAGRCALQQSKSKRNKCAGTVQ